MTDLIVGPEAVMGDAGVAPTRVAHRPVPDTEKSAMGADSGRNTDLCVICGMAAVVERRCKVICTHCGTILQSCADL